MSFAGEEEGPRLEPRANPALLGQEAAEATLLAAVKSGRLPHAWLIGGARGVGKATLAYRFARYLLSGNADSAPGLFGQAAPESLAMPSSDPLFQRIAARGHPDLFTLERTVNEKSGKLRTEIVVEDVRSVGSFLRLTPAEGGWRIVVVDCADELNRSAANALLKVLEEPPRQAVLLLVAHAPGSLLPTIRSRCRALAMPPLAPATVAKLLAQYRPDIDEEDRRMLVQLGEGSIGRALDLADAGGVGLYRAVIELLAAMPQLDMAAVHAMGDRLARADGAENFRTVGELLAWWLMRMVRGAAAGSLPTEMVPGEGAAMQRLLADRDLDRWVALWEKITLLFAQADDLALDRKQVVLTAFLDFAAAARG